MTRIGAHLSISKGLRKTADEAVERGLETLQVFLRNPRGRGAREFSPDETAYFTSVIRHNDINPVVVHIPYICNPAAHDSALYEAAADIIAGDLQRCHLVGADYLVLHPGAYTRSTPEEAMQRVSQLLNRVLADYRGHTMILLETMAGQGTELGSSFEQLHGILDAVERQEKLGICLDTCHLFAAGYDCASREGIEELMKAIDATMGRHRIKVLHANDSSKPLGSRRDRHAHIGQGFIGLEGFANLLHHDCLGQLPFIVETPPEGLTRDIEILHSLQF